MTDQKTIDLLIQTKLKGGREYKTITDAVLKLEAAVEEQSKAADRGEGKIEGLTAALTALKEVQAELSGRASMVDNLKKVTGQIVTQEEKVAKLAAELKKYRESLKNDATETQQKRLDRLNRSYDNASKVLVQYQTSAANTSAALRQAGINTDQLVATQEGIIEQQTRAQAAIMRVSTALQNYSQNALRVRDAQKALSESTAKLERLEAGNADDARLGRLQREQRALEEQVRQQALLNRLEAGNADDARLGRIQSEAQAKQAEQRALEEQTRQQALLNRLEAGNQDDARLGRLQREQRAIEEQARQQALLNRLEAGNVDDARLGRLQAQERALAEQVRQAALLSRFEAGNENDARLGRLQTDDLAKQNAALRATAEEASRAAEQYNTLVRASTNLRPKVVSLRDALDSLINPSAKARESLDGIEKQIADIGRQMSMAGGKVKDYSATLKELQAIQKSIQGQGTAIDQFGGQLASLRNARTEFLAARSAVKEYADEVRKGGDAAAQFTRPLAEAQTRLRQAALALREQVTATRQSRDALRQAGIDTSNLAASQQRLVNAAQQSTAALKTLTSAAVQNGEAVAKSNKGFQLFRDEGRTTLSMAQRLRGEILALTTAYFGIQGAINLAAGALKAFSQKQGTESTLAFAFDTQDTKIIGDQMNYVAAQADRLGLALNETSQSYAKFAASALKAGAPVQEAQYIFEAFAETGRVLRLTPDQMSGLFTAFGQSFSKTKIQAEEILQVAERLPGAFARAQESLKDQFPDLSKALKEGKVGAENLLVIAESFRKAAQGGLKTAIQSLDAEQERFNNSVLAFKLAIAESGFADAYISLLKELTILMKSAEGQQLAQSVADLGKAVIGTISFLVDWRNEIQLIAMTIATLIGAGWITKMGAGILAIGTATAAAGPAVAALSVSISLLGVALKTLAKIAAAFFIGVAIGDWLYDQSETVRIFAAKMVYYFDTFFTKVKYNFKIFLADIPNGFRNMFIDAFNIATLGVRSLLKIFKAGAAALGQTGLAETIDKALNGAFAPLKNSESNSPVVAALKKELEQQLAASDDALQGMIRDANRSRPTAVKNAIANTAKPPTRPNSAAGDDEAGAKKRAKEIKAIEEALDELDAKALKKQEDSLDSLLKAVDKQYEDLSERIAALGGAAGRDFAKRFADGILSLKGEITKDFNDKLAKEQGDLAKKIEAAEIASGKKQKDELKSRTDAVALEYKSVYDDIEKFRQRLQAAGKDTTFATEMKKTLDLSVEQLQNLARINFLRDELKVKEQAINDLLNARKIALDRVEERAVTENLTPGQTDAAKKEVIARMEPGIQSALAAAKEFALANEAAFDPARLQEFLLKLDQATNSSRTLNSELDRTTNIINDGITAGVDQGFEALYESIGKLTTKTGDLGDVFENVGKTMLQVFAETLKQIAMLYLKEQMLIAIQAIRIAMGGGGGNVGFSPGNGVQHAGGMAGQSNRVRRGVPVEAWNLAPRYHDGGMVGLRHNEVASILEKNEEVLSKDDPRNIMNGGAAANPGAPSGGGNLRVVLVDDQRRVQEALASPEGGQVVMAHVKANAASLRQLLK